MPGSVKSCVRSLLEVRARQSTWESHIPVPGNTRSLIPRGSTGRRKTMAAPVVTMQQLIEAGAHFGHQTHRWNPRMKPYIFGQRNGIHILDLSQTRSEECREGKECDSTCRTWL